MKMKKLMNKENMLVLVLAGILLLVAALPTKGTQTDRVQGAGTIAVSQQKPEEEAMAYKRQMEQEVETLLTAMDGVGKVKVMLVLKSSWEEVPAPSAGSFLKSESENVSTVLSPKVQGIVVVAQGAGQGQVTKEVTEALMHLFHLEANQVKVVKMKTQ